MLASSVSQFKCCVREVFPEQSLSSTFTRLDFNVSTVLNTNKWKWPPLYGLRLSSPLGSELNVRPSLFSNTILRLLPRTVAVIQPMISKYVLKERKCGWTTVRLLRDHNVLLYIHPATVDCFRGRHPGRPAAGEFMRFGDCNEEDDGSSSQVPEL